MDVTNRAAMTRSDQRLALINEEFGASSAAALETTQANERAIRHADAIQDMEHRRLNVEKARARSELESTVMQKPSLENDRSLPTLEESKLTIKMRNDLDKFLMIEMCSPNRPHLMRLPERPARHVYPTERILEYGHLYGHPLLRSTRVEIYPPLYPPPAKSSESCSHDSLAWHLAVLCKPSPRVFPRGRPTLGKDRPVQRDGA